MAYHASFSAEQLRSGSSRIPAITTRIIGLVGTCAILAASVSACRSTKTGTPSDLTTRQASAVIDELSSRELESPREHPGNARHPVVAHAGEV